MKAKNGVGKLIKDRRLEKGITQRDIALSVGVTEGWESGEIGNMCRDRLLSLAKVLDIPPLVLLGVDLEDASAPASDTENTLAIPKNFGLQTVRRIMRAEGRDVRMVPRIGSIAYGTPILAEENMEGFVCAGQMLTLRKMCYT